VPQDIVSAGSDGEVGACVVVVDADLFDDVRRQGDVMVTGCDMDILTILCLFP
jgi:hypothetical protein